MSRAGRNEFVQNLQVATPNTSIEYSSELDRYSREYKQGYCTHIEYQEPYFIEIVNLITNLLTILKEANIISEYFQVGARIKSYSSSEANYLKEKNLDDICGIELIGANELEKQIFSDLIASLIKEKEIKGRKSKKVVSKDNGYSAIHYNGEIQIDYLEDSIKQLDFPGLTKKKKEELFSRIQESINIFRTRIRRISEEEKNQLVNVCQKTLNFK